MALSLSTITTRYE